MAAVAGFSGPKAFDLSEKFIKKLQELKVFGIQTLAVNGDVRIVNIQADKVTLIEDDATAVVLPTHLAEHHVELLAAMTADEGDDVFATAIQVGRTLGSAKGQVF